MTQKELLQTYVDKIRELRVDILFDERLDTIQQSFYDPLNEGSGKDSAFFLNSLAHLEVAACSMKLALEES